MYVCILWNGDVVVKSVRILIVLVGSWVEVDADKSREWTSVHTSTRPVRRVFCLLVLLHDQAVCFLSLSTSLKLGDWTCLPQRLLVFLRYV
jgi:hypothetical protein